MGREEREIPKAEVYKPGTGWDRLGQGNARHALGLYLSWPPKELDLPSACHHQRLKRQCRKRRRHIYAWLCWECYSSPNT